MAADFETKLYYASLEKAAKEGEEIARAYEFVAAPIDPFKIVHAEQELIHFEEHDFNLAFDGRIKFVGPRFLICVNTKYNEWPHTGRHHTKIIFTLGHELGHFFLPKHRDYLVTSKKPHKSFTEFSADPLVEIQADSFASGLLMPSYLLKPLVNRSNFISMSDFHEVRKLFKVSLTGLLVRWAQLSDFPMATIAIRDGRICYGWISSGLRNKGAFALRKGDLVRGKDAKAFVSDNRTDRRYRQAEGSGAIMNWIEFDRVRLLTQEFYFYIPHTNTVWVFAVADEEDFE